MTPVSEKLFVQTLDRKFLDGGRSAVSDKMSTSGNRYYILFMNSAGVQRGTFSDNVVQRMTSETPTLCVIARPSPAYPGYVSVETQAYAWGHGGWSHTLPALEFCIEHWLKRALDGSV